MATIPTREALSFPAQLDRAGRLNHRINHRSAAAYCVKQSVVKFMNLTVQTSNDIYLELRQRHCQLGKAIMENALSKLERIGIAIKVNIGGIEERPLTKAKLSYHFAAESESRPGTSTSGMTRPWVMALCGFIVLAFVTLCMAQLPPLPKPLLLYTRSVFDADPPEVKPGYYMNCPDPVCPNTDTMGPSHWRYTQGDTNWIDIEYRCTNCATHFWVRKPTH